MVSSTRCTPTRSRKNYDTTKTVNRDTSWTINSVEREKTYLWSLANMFQQSLDQLLLHCRIAVDPDLKVGIHMQKELTVQLFGIRHGGCQFLEPMHRDASAVVRGSTSVREQITNQLEAMRRAHLVLVQSASVTHGRSLAASASHGGHRHWRQLRRTWWTGDLRECRTPGASCWDRPMSRSRRAIGQIRCCLSGETAVAGA